MKLREKILRIGMPVGAILASIGIGFAGVTSAQSAASTASPAGFARMGHGMGIKGEKPVVVGKVTAISGSTITVQNQKPGETSLTAYTVNASSAKVMKATEGAAPTESSVSAVAVGDMVAVHGTVSGTTVTATEIMDGVMRGGRGGHGRGPGAHGTVTAVQGNTITITGKNGTTYTVDASSAEVSKMTTISVSQIAVGDKIGVMGDVSGTNITAKHIMDGIPQRSIQQ